MSAEGTRQHRATAARRRCLRRRSGSSRGAALVEFALILPVLFLILFGIIEFGVALNDYQSIRHGVRDGTRQAVVRQYGTTDTGCTTVTNTDPAVQAEVRKVICLTKDRIGLGNDVRVRVQYTGPSGAAGDFGSVLVCAQRNVDPFTGAIPAIDGITLKSSIEMRMEQAIPAAILGSTSYPTPKVYSEAAPPGSDWSEC